MPADDRLWPNDDQRAFPVGHHPSQENPDGSIAIRQARGFLLAAEDLKLMPEGDTLQNQRSTGLKKRRNQA
jgi:hypothetical protein